MDGKVELPSFFESGEGEVLEEALEPEGLETTWEADTAFPTARATDGEEFFFLDYETAANQRLLPFLPDLKDQTNDQHENEKAKEIEREREREREKDWRDRQGMNIQSTRGHQSVSEGWGGSSTGSSVPSGVGTPPQLWGSPRDSPWAFRGTPPSQGPPAFPPSRSQGPGAIPSTTHPQFPGSFPGPTAYGTGQVRSVAEVEASLHRNSAAPQEIPAFPPIGHASPKRSQDSHTPQRAVQQYRPRWKESKEWMSAAEIESLIRVAEGQLHGNAGNPFAEDYYFLMQRQRPEVGAVTLHPPLASPNPTPQSSQGPQGAFGRSYDGKKGSLDAKKTERTPDGVLGRIPSHSVRAPRALLKLPGALDSPAAAPKELHSLLLLCERAYALLLLLQDVRLLRQHPSGDQGIEVQGMGNLREAEGRLTVQLFQSLHLHLLPPDDIFVNMVLVKKGKKLLVRALPLLFPQQVWEIFLVYLRNLSLIVTSPRLEMDVNDSHRLFASFAAVVAQSSAPLILQSFHTLLASHSSAQLRQILQTKWGLPLVQHILKRAHDLQLSPFSRGEEPAPPASPGAYWKDHISGFVNRLTGTFPLLFQSEIGQTSKVWEFLAVLVVNISTGQKRAVMQELRDIILHTPTHPTLQAFLQLVGEPFFK